MFTLIRTEDFNSYLLKHFMCDDITDLNNIVTQYEPTNELHAGWTGLVTTTSSTEKYILMNDKKTWSKVTNSGGSSPTPEPSPDNHYIYDGGGVAGY